MNKRSQEACEVGSMYRYKGLREWGQPSSIQVGMTKGWRECPSCLCLTMTGVDEAMEMCNLAGKKNCLWCVTDKGIPPSRPQLEVEATRKRDF